MELKWDFKSWVPLVSKFCPNDVYRIWKMGSCVRCDTTIAGFKDMKWLRGNISLVFTGRSSGRSQKKQSKNLFGIGKIALINHDTKKVEYVNDSFQKTDEQVAKEVQSIMCRTVVRGDLLLENCSFAQSSKKTKIGEYNCKIYNASKLKYVTLHRSDTTKSDKHTPRKPRDEPPALNFDEYFYEVVSFPPGKGVGMIYDSERLRKKTRKFRGTVAMSDNFPISVDNLMPLLEVLVPTGKHFEKLKSFCKSKLPPGQYPVEIGLTLSFIIVPFLIFKSELPVFPTIVATITFQKFEKKDTIDDSLFEIPANYDVVNIHLLDFIMGENSEPEGPI
jgi:hypothetical protein